MIYIGDKPQEIDNKELGFNEFITVFSYDEAAKNLVIGFKDGNKPYLGEYISRFLIDEYKKHKKDAEMVVFVPSSKKKIAIRGYDPMRIVAKHFSESTGLETAPALKRKNKQIDQTESKDRYKNIKGQFTYNQADIKAKKLLLIDDVVTTGATASECANILINNGAKSVTLLTFTEAHTFKNYKNKTIKRMQSNRHNSI